MKRAADIGNTDNGDTHEVISVHWIKSLVQQKDCMRALVAELASGTPRPMNALLAPSMRLETCSKLLPPLDTIVKSDPVDTSPASEADTRCMRTAPCPPRSCN